MSPSRSRCLSVREGRGRPQSGDGIPGEARREERGEELPVPARSRCGGGRAGGSGRGASQRSAWRRRRRPCRAPWAPHWAEWGAGAVGGVASVCSRVSQPPADAAAADSSFCLLLPRRASPLLECYLWCGVPFLFFLLLLLLLLLPPLYQAPSTNCLGVINRLPAYYLLHFPSLLILLL
mgnify:CR=1 FL=1